jgi:hypothetical protein
MLVNPGATNGALCAGLTSISLQIQGSHANQGLNGRSGAHYSIEDALVSGTIFFSLFLRVEF